MSPRFDGRCLLLAWILCTFAAPAHAQSVLCSPRQTAAGPVSAAQDGALFCMDLVPVPQYDHIRAVIELHPIAAGPAVRVTPNGNPRQRLVAWIDSLPDPATLGPYRAYVAWATTLSMDTLIRLGQVRTGRNELGEVQLDQFRVLVSAEASAEAHTRTGRLLLRGTSPSTRLMAHRDVTRSGPLGNAPLAVDSGVAGHSHHETWPMPAMDPRVPPMPGMMDLRPNADPFLPTVRDTAAVPFARPRRIVSLNEGDTLKLEAGLVRRRIAGKTFLMYGFNQQYPGPLIQVRQRTTIHVEFHNALDQPSTVHWHGIRLDNRFDGVPHLTQQPVQPGERFVYTIHFPDAGIYWYHPHYREDIQQDLGLYGNLLVDELSPDAYAPAHRSEVLTLDDLLVNEQGLLPFGADTPTHALMGRFGNIFLVNGEPSYQLQVRRDEVVRFFLTNVSNARPFNVSLDGARMKLVGSDVGRYEREEWVQNVVLAPAERAIVDVLFERAGQFVLANRVRALNHALGTYSQEVDTLGVVSVSEPPAQPDLSGSFEQLRSNADVIRDIDAYRVDFTKPPERELVLSMRTDDLPGLIASMATGFPVPVDWNDGMSMMNWATTGREVHWILRDASDGLENMQILWSFRRGQRVRLRVVNEPNVFHAMAHPIHLHGQRLLILSRNGQPTQNHAWKDTALVQAGETVELLVEMTNPGRWMLHCHVAEHLGTGMMLVFEVSDR